MIPIFDCGYGKFKCLLKLIKKEKTEAQLYKGNLKRKKKRDEEEDERIRNSFMNPN